MDRSVGRIRVQLQLKVARSTDQLSAPAPQHLERFDAHDVGRQQIPQVEFDQMRPRTGAQQLRDLRDAEPACQPHHAPIGFLNDANPTFHGVMRGKTQATRRPAREWKNRRENGVSRRLRRRGPMNGVPDHGGLSGRNNG